MESPPRERPSASRPACPAAGFLSFANAPRGQFRRPGAAGASGVLVGAHHGGIGADRAALALGPVTGLDTHIGATVGGNATGFSPLSPVAVPLWADPRVGSLTPLAVRLLFRPYSWAIKRESISRGPFLPYSGRPRIRA